PQILEEKIEQPIIITGLPRTGTSLLQILLSLDPTTRFIRNWESSMAICPPPELVHSSTDPRIQAYHLAMEGFFGVMPKLRGINGINFMAGGPAECQNLMAHEFIHFGYSAGSSLFSYGEWLSECNMAHAYQYHKKLLQVLQWKMPDEKWVLKAPMHLFGLDHLLETYPDARVVFTHRDPIKAMSSGASMVYHWTLFSTQQADTAAIGKWWPKIWAKGMERALKVRDNFNPTQFFDLYHKNFSQDPIGAVHEIYDHFNLCVGKGHLRRMQAWLRDNPRSRFGNHDHTPAQFELNPKKVKEQFQFYCDRFDV
ncbi:MAG: sulfotransferase, partial [Proteobacteria bacterium]|nr:sulfotransferase [Pseudomonadota bacterium]